MLGHPTILEYAKYMGISQPNATYKINQLIEKGYLIKEVSKEDKRSYRLQVTKKFLAFYRDNDRFIKKSPWWYWKYFYVWWSKITRKNVTNN